MYEFSPLGWLKHCVFHPVEGFEDLRWKKQGSVKIALFIVFLLFVAMVVDRQLTGFQFNENYVKVFNVVPLLVQSVVYFFTWVIGNWAICTLLDGEGTLKRILVYSAYSLVPKNSAIFSPFFGIYVAKPKSINFIKGLLSASIFIKKFSGFKSRCIIPFSKCK